MSGLLAPPKVNGTTLKPDTCVLGSNVRSAMGSESADDWFQKFESSAREWPSLDSFLIERASAAPSSSSTSLGKRKKKEKENGPLDEATRKKLISQLFDLTPEIAEEMTKADTVMRLRFARAFNDLEKSGLVKCSKSDKSDAISVSRQIFTWI